MQHIRLLEDLSQACDDLETPFCAWEKHVLRGYALSALRPEKGSRKVRLTSDFLQWYRENRKPLGLDVAALNAQSKLTPDTLMLMPEIGLPITRRGLDACAGVAPARRSGLAKRLDWVARLLGLPAREAAVLGAVVRLTGLVAFREFRSALCGEPVDSDEVKGTVAARVCGLSAAESRALFAPSGALRQFGLVEDRRGGDWAPSRTLMTVLGGTAANERQLARTLLGPAIPSSLEPADFAHLGAGAQAVPTLLRNALARAEKGVGVLFYGLPGTGKTEFARLLGPLLDAHVVFVGETGEDGPEPSRADRMSHLAFLSSLGSRIGRVIAVVDEADDVFCGIDDAESANRRGSKVFMNRIVESCPVPTIWISNNPGLLGTSIVRRMVQAVEFREPDLAARRRIVARVAAAQGLALDQAEAERLALLPAPPAVIEAGIRAARLVGGIEAAAAAQGLLKAMGRKAQPELLPSTASFDPALSSADIDLAELERRVVAVGPVALSFLLSGLPGTGKSLFARRLAEKLGLKVLEKRGSDLLDKYVGGTEANIAGAFAEAAERRNFLVFDEVDSLLFDRRGAHRNWEVSQVNEMLQAMERHPLPFACTTNFVENLDPATLRRFLFKVRFTAMSGEQARLAFRRFFGCPATLGVSRLDPLTPGDFAVVAKKAEVLGERDPLRLAAMLREEVEAKASTACGRVGFIQ